MAWRHKRGLETQTGMETQAWPGDKAQSQSGSPTKHDLVLTHLEFLVLCFGRGSAEGCTGPQVGGAGDGTLGTPLGEWARLERWGRGEGARQGGKREVEVGVLSPWGACLFAV